LLAVSLSLPQLATSRLKKLTPLLTPKPTLTPLLKVVQLKAVPLKVAPLKAVPLKVAPLKVALLKAKRRLLSNSRALIV
jgi:hypothetical protein